MARIDGSLVVCDAGPLIHLDELGCIDLLSDMAPVIAPEIVFKETRYHRPRLQLNVIAGLTMSPITDSHSAQLAVLVDTFNLDAGETAALTLAEHHTLHMFLTDDAAARLAAESLGFRVHGTIGIIIRSIRRHLRSRQEALDILMNIRERSTLHIARNLLNEVIAHVAAG